MVAGAAAQVRIPRMRKTRVCAGSGICPVLGTLWLLKWQVRGPVSAPVSDLLRLRRVLPPILGSSHQL